MILLKRRVVLAAGASLPIAVSARKPRAALGAGLPTGADATTAPPDEAGKTLPAFQFTTADGAVRSAKDLAGSGVVLNFWATWCVPCVEEMPALAKLNGLVHDSGVRVLPLSSDRGGAAAVERYFTQHEIVGLPVLLDPRGEAARAFGARGIPTTILIDAKGRERGRVEGARAWDSETAVAMVKALAG